MLKQLITKVSNSSFLPHTIPEILIATDHCDSDLCVISWWF